MALQKYKISFILDLVFYWYGYLEHFYKLKIIILITNNFKSLSIPIFILQAHYHRIIIINTQDTKK